MSDPTLIPVLPTYSQLLTLNSLISLRMMELTKLLRAAGDDEFLVEAFTLEDAELHELRTVLFAHFNQLNDADIDRQIAEYHDQLGGS